jgi:hypothetical protein
MDPSIIIQALVQLPEGELQEMLAEARRRAYRAKIEVEQIEEAIKVVSPSSTGRGRTGQTRERILEYVREHGPVAPKQVIEFMGGADDDSVAPVVYNALSRMARDRELTRTDSGYELSQVAPTQPPIEGFGKQMATALLAVQQARQATAPGIPRVGAPANRG